jgi:sec-independent protein translocase protein TatC
MKRVLQSIWRFITAPLRGFIWIWQRLPGLIIMPFRKLNYFFSDDSEATNTPLGDVLGTVFKQPGSIMPHLEALRKHFFRSIFVLFLFSILAFTFIRPIMQFLAYPLPGGMETLTAIDITENIGAVMKVALLSGFAISIPYIAFEIWLFFAPGIKPGSRLSSLLAIPLALIFFICGMAFAYGIMLPAALPFLFNFMGLTTQPRPSSYYNFVTAILFWIGLFFEFPLVAFLLARMGLLRSETLKSQWRLAVIIMAVLAAAITPTVDPFNMLLVFAPMLILYCIAIVLAAIAQKRRQLSTR